MVQLTYLKGMSLGKLSVVLSAIALITDEAVLWQYGKVRYLRLMQILLIIPHNPVARLVLAEKAIQLLQP